MIPTFPIIDIAPPPAPVSRWPDIAAVCTAAATICEVEPGVWSAWWRDAAGIHNRRALVPSSASLGALIAALGVPDNLTGWRAVGAGRFDLEK